MKKVVLAGSPNTGKSLLFSRITGVGVISSNYPDTTVEIKCAKFKYCEQEYELFDIPGIYSLQAFSTAEKIALDLIDKADIIINVLDATNLERHLNLTLQLLLKNKPIIVCLNFWDDTTHKGISIDTEKLQKLLNVCVVSTSALTGQGISNLVSSLEIAHSPKNPQFFDNSNKNSWSVVGQIVSQVQKLSHRHHSFLETLGDITLHPIGGFISAIFIVITTFFLVRLIGENLIKIFESIYSNYYYPFIKDIISSIHINALTHILLGHSAEDALSSFGILTSGVYIAMVSVFPYFFAFYFIFGFLEDFGYIPRLAIFLDAFLHRIGLHGYSSIPVMLGLGCKVPGYLSTRILSNKREKILTTSLILMSAPCLPQSVMIFSLGMQYGIKTIFFIFSTLFITGIIFTLVLNKIIKGDMPEFFMEIPVYRIPSIKNMTKKLWLRIKEYFLEVFPMIVIGVFIINILDYLKILQFISLTIGKFVSYLLGLPQEIASVLILGFLRKDVSIALLAPFNLSGHQFVIASIFMVLYIPCIASLFTLIKELGIVSAGKVIGVVFFVAIALTTFLNLIFKIVL